MRWFIPLLVFVFVAGCSTPQPPLIEEVSILCGPPYFEFKDGECCLDENSNQVCDVDEIQKFPEEEEEAVEIPDSCYLGTYFDCTNINIKKDDVMGGFVSFDLTFKKFGAAVVTKIDFPQLGCSYTNDFWSIDDGVRQTPKSFYIKCPFKGDVLSSGYADSEMVVDIIHYDEVRQGVDSAWTGVYDIRNFTITGHVSGSI
ncbi:MAG: hypothetical protein ABIH63_01095 [archaeon]